MELAMGPLADVLTVLLLAALAAGFLARAGKDSLRGSSLAAAGWYSGQRAPSTEGSEAARRLLATYLPRQTFDAATEAAVDGWLQRAQGRPFDAEALARVAEVSGSIDLAALLFALSASEGGLQESFERHLEEVRTGRNTDGSPYSVVFVPGWLYESHQGTGADFAAPRALLRRLGIEEDLVPTQENGSIEANAKIVAGALRRRGHGEREVIVVSASKGGPEVALALSSLGSEASRVAAWVNIGGVLGGTALADKALEGVRGWFVKTLFRQKGWTKEGLESLTTQASRRRRDLLTLPAGPLIVNLVAVPFSGDISWRARSGYRKLSRHGPNDGLTLLADAVVPGAETLVVLGSDHYFAGIEADELTLAVLRTLEAALPSSMEALVP